MATTLHKSKHAQEEREETMPDALVEWISLDRKPSKDDDWLRYARQKPKRRAMAP